MIALVVVVFDYNQNSCTHQAKYNKIPMNKSFILYDFYSYSSPWYRDFAPVIKILLKYAILTLLQHHAP